MTSLCQIGTGRSSDRDTCTVHENRIYSLKLYCDGNYPDSPPTVQFLSRINLPCVNQQTGKVEPSKLSCLGNWKCQYSLETILTELRRYVNAAALFVVGNGPNLFCVAACFILTAVPFPGVAGWWCGGVGWDRALREGKWPIPRTRSSPSLQRAACSNVQETVDGRKMRSSQLSNHHRLWSVQPNVCAGHLPPNAERDGGEGPYYPPLPPVPMRSRKNGGPRWYRGRKLKPGLPPLTPPPVFSPSPPPVG
ncbi:MAG: hypothetical protein BJ554DRAFT_5856 [Olpidium bornovanus]|uniref:UBC core domain-containing protein n=1 Tax=Olpidium bornovanus TaxID=278681 RepID=A0A8H8DKP0_9FUNG|nr:MAG: hypothetical protein BJ554DRAFT_5856 [Olpidium bornovanus]